ncbi:hypothetical protein LOAG_13077 [Loa loa]|uniref:G-protein coupled receptors family 1 profile domain-containing protein n=1 Tax=Loa loa TaxID=7209 RepID=A0A1S0TKM5_LOALO|nr:hypothetical protein LOAG_13077 [Loa loa]EFO15433.1 hypothetical protein LOAG_13077 [Loa loa]
MAFVILHNGLTGLINVILGVTRLIDINHFTSNQLVNSYYCLLHYSNILTLLLSLNGLGLLAYSLDRLLVIRFPIMYFKNMKKVVIILVIMIYIIPFITMIISIALELLLPPRYVPPICFEHLIYAENTYSVILCIRTLAATLSIPVMLLVIVIMHRKRQTIIAMNQSISFANIDAFIERQKAYTKTAIWSCSTTFFLYIVPAINQLIHDRLDTLNENEMALYALLLGNINSYNMVIIFIYRQKDILKEIINMLTGCHSLKKTERIIPLFVQRINGVRIV